MISDIASRSSHAHSELPSPWIVRFAHLVSIGARVLDVAAGSGRHARFFASRGARVLAIDRDAEALTALSSVGNVETRTVDLENGGWPLGDAQFDAIVVVNYLHRPLFAHLLAALRPDGVLLYETFAIGNEQFGRPRNPDFLLRSAELLDVTSSRLTIVAFEQGRVEEGRHSAVIQRLAAVGKARVWPPSLAGDNAERT
jgi:SAM-dependent methyltransferase